MVSVLVHAVVVLDPEGECLDQPVDSGALDVLILVCGDCGDSAMVHVAADLVEV